MICHVPRCFRLLAFCLASIAGGTASAGPLTIWVTILPQKYFVERIGGERVAVEVLVHPGQSPETYAPSGRQMGRLAKAQLFFGIGMPVERAVLPRLEQSMTGVRFVQTGPEPVGHAHDHAHGEGCVHGDTDPHVWMDPAWVASTAELIRDHLIALDPDGAEFYLKRAAAFVGELKELDAELRERMRPCAGRAFYINHPSLGHFAEAYGLRQVSVEASGGQAGARRMAELIKAAKADGVRAVFSQPQFGRSSVDVLARALGVAVVEVNPLAEDYFENMRAVAEAMEKGLPAL